MLRSRKEKNEKDLKLATAVDINECLKPIKLPMSLHTCAPLSKLPSNTITMRESTPNIDKLYIMQKKSIYRFT